MGQATVHLSRLPYYKVESTTKAMSREMFEERLRAHKPIFYAWERQVAEGVGIADLNEERVRGALCLGFDKGRVYASALTEQFGTVLDKLELLNDGKPNNAAASLFATNVREYPQFRLRMARFRGTDKNEFIDNQRVDGNFFDLLDAGMDFFLRHLSMSERIVGFRREESLEVPAEALREALNNALCHRQYEKYNLTPSIAIYKDRIEIENPGVLPPQLTPETIKDSHNSYPYNLIIADVLFKTTFVENWGTGAKRIIDVCRQHDVEEPTWSVNGGFICVTFKRPNYGLSTPQVEGQKDSITPQVHPKYPPSAPQIQLLIEKMGDGFMAPQDIMVACEKKDSKYFRTNYLIPALAENAIEHKYPDSPNHPHQQYRLTEQAKKWKKFHQ